MNFEASLKWAKEIGIEIEKELVEIPTAPYGCWLLNLDNTQEFHLDPKLAIALELDPSFEDSQHFLERILGPIQEQVLQSLPEAGHLYASRIEYYVPDRIHFFSSQFAVVSVNGSKHLVVFHQERLQIPWTKADQLAFNYCLSTTEEGNYRYVNDSYLKVFNRRTEQGESLIGEAAIGDILPQSHQDAFEAAEAVLKEPGKVVEVTLEKLASGDQVYSTFWQFIYWPSTGLLPGGIYARGYDISALEKAQESLKANKRELDLYYAFFENTYDALQVSDISGQLIYLNSEASRRLGIPMSEVHQYKVQDFERLFQERPKAWEEHIQYLRENSVWKNRSINYNQDTGQEVIVDVVVKLVEISGKEFVVANSRDITDQVKLERSMKEKEEELGLFFNNTLLGAFFMMLPRPLDWHDGIDKEAALDWVFENQMITRVNQAMLDQYGYQHENEILGLRPKDFFQHDIPAGKKLWLEFFDKGHHKQISNERRLDGSEAVFEGDYKLIKDEQGRILGHFGVQQDVTERDFARRDLEQGRDLLQKLTERIPGVVFQLTMHGQEPELSFLSSSFDQLDLGIARTKVLEKPVEFLKRIDPADYSLVMGSILYAHRKSSKLNIDFRFHSADDRLHYFNAEARPVIAKSGKVNWYGVLSDRTEFRRVEEEQRRLVHATKNVSDGILILNADNAIEWLNSAAEEFVNTDRESALNSKLPALLQVTEESRSDYEGFLSQLELHRKSKARLRTQNETGGLWTLIEHLPIWNNNGEYLYGLVLIRDVDEMISKQDELQSLLDLAADQNKRLQSFTYIVSHNIRSYSANMTGLLDAMELEEDEAEREKLWNYMRDVSAGLDETIRDLNEIISIDTKLNQQKQSIALRKQIDSILKIVQLQLEEIGARLKIEVDESVMVNQVASYGESIILNLITNAIRYREPSRNLVLRIKYREEEDFHVLEVSDNGLGIDLKKYGKRLFSLYQTFHRNPEARGLGLYILRSQAEAMGGSVEVKSIVGQGTSFSVYFPKD